MNSETKNCQNCKQVFTIEPDDFAFYEKVKVPPPTFCRECRLQRRMAYRNERALYKRVCDAPGHTEEMISVFSPDKPDRIYDHKAWWSDAWDPMVYGKKADFSKPLFTQIRELWREVPDIAILNINPVNSDYCSITEDNKNCYLVIRGDYNEDCLYAAFVFNSKDCMDTYWVLKSELNYETVDSTGCSRLRWSRYCEGCYESAFLFNCKNCHDCFGCVNLVNGAYQIFNVKYSKEAYLEKLKEFNLSDYDAIEELKKKFKLHSLKYPRRFTKAIQSVNSIGDNLEETKNCRFCFEVGGGAEDSAYIWLAYSNVKNCYDCDHFGRKSENSCEASTIYPGSRVFFSKFIFSSHDVYYSYNCHNSSYLFGCIGLRSKQYCVLNKQYTKEEYEALVPKLIAHMNTMPYADQGGRIHGFGEFFPAELSPFAYNETIAQEYFPLTKEQALAQGYRWKDAEEKNYKVTLRSEDVPKTISGVTDGILEQIIGCAHNGTCTEQCTAAFKIVPQELAFYRRMNIPLPRCCSNCRHYARAAQRNPLKLWHRACQCAGDKSANGAYANTAPHPHGAGPCKTDFQTPYAPEKPEIVYCEQCYQAEVA